MSEVLNVSFYVGLGDQRSYKGICCLHLTVSLRKVFSKENVRKCLTLLRPLYVNNGN